MNPHVAVIIQARMDSTRLPGKVLMPIDGCTMLQRVIDRVDEANDGSLDVTWWTCVATTTRVTDDPIEYACDRIGHDDEKLFRYNGDPRDVLGRYLACARQNYADIIVRVTSDCPLIDPDLIRRGVAKYLNQDVFYASTVAPESRLPEGLDCEIFSIGMLAEADKQTRDLVHREHVTLWMRGQPGTYSIQADVPMPRSFSDQHWSVDTEADLRFVRNVYEYFGHDKFTWKDVMLAVLAGDLKR